MMKLREKVIVVTGGGSGIGRELVLGLLDRGASVAAADIRKENLDETAELANAGDRLSIFEVDVSDREAVHAFADNVVSAFGAVDGYVSNAGIIQPFVRLNELDYAAIERVLAVNLDGTIHMAKAFLPRLLQRPEAHIVNVSSMGGFLPVPGQTVYGASKAAVKLLTEGLYAELLDTAVRVSLVMPGAVATNISENSGVAAPTGDEPVDADATPTTTAEDAARIILDGVERDRFHIYVGRDAKTMSLLSRLAPKRATHLIYKKMKELLPT
jgi:NAD(P)-dependent dehydrogenase (short-subunit alcohol dehydrogenase family)